jgi:hypothetical protein
VLDSVLRTDGTTFTAARSSTGPDLASDGIQEGMVLGGFCATGGAGRGVDAVKSVASCLDDYVLAKALTNSGPGSTANSAAGTASIRRTA